MISFLKGKVEAEKPGMIILVVAGVGYKIFISSKLEIIKDQIKEFFISQYIREDRSDLYGFETFDELELFEKLLSVNGVGPKAAMAIMTISDTSKIISAIDLEDVNYFCSIPGIGKKVAAKIILDLKSKISISASESIISSYNVSSDIVDALVSLGFKKNEINKIITKMPGDLEGDQDKIKWALNQLT